MKKYLNWKGETIDEIDPKQFDSFKGFRKERRRLLDEYAMAGMGGDYWSSRMCANWRD